MKIYGAIFATVMIFFSYSTLSDAAEWYLGSEKQPLNPRDTFVSAPHLHAIRIAVDELKRRRVDVNKYEVLVIDRELSDQYFVLFDHSGTLLNLGKRGGGFSVFIDKKSFLVTKTEIER
jgi:hypothetical protein